MLKYRVFTGGIFLALVAVLYIWAPTWMLGVVVLGLTGLAVLEMVDLMSAAGYPALKWTSLGMTLLWMLAAWAQVNGSGRVLILLPVVAVWVICLGCLFRSDQSRSLDKLAGTFTTLAYVAGLMQFIILLLFSGNAEDGRSLLLYGILVIKSTDMGAYFVGTAIGKHKLIPAISPGKTWEGVVGGVGVATLVSSLLLYLYGYLLSGYAFNWVDGLVLGFGLGSFGVIGDLVESMLKRAAGIKDSGSWLKGMGGILDVLDSLIFALPLLYLYIHWGLIGR